MRQKTLAAIIAAVYIAALGGAANAAAAPLNWSAPMAIDPGHAIDSLACPTSSLCVAGDSNGTVLASTNPAGGTAAWSKTAIDGNEPIESLSCPDASLCVGVDYYGHVLTSTNPAGGAAAWHQMERLEIALMDVSCASTSFCAITQQDGDFFYSPEPANEAWLDGGEVSPAGFHEQGLSCPSASLCLATTANNMEVLSSTEPTHGPSAWSSTTPDPSGIHGIDCPSTSFCTAVNGESEVLTTSTPTSGNWTRHALAVPVNAVNCASTAFCVASESNGNLLESTDPTGGASAWTMIHSVAPWSGVAPVDCVSATFCVAADYNGNVYVANPSVPPRYRLTVNEEGKGAAIVNSSPEGIECNGPRDTCSREFAGGTVVTLTGSTRAGWTFDGWSGGGCSGTGPCQVTLNDDTEVTAHVSMDEEEPALAQQPTLTPPITPTPPPAAAQTPASNVSPSPSLTPHPKPKPKKKPLKCRKGFKKQRVHGKAKCVRVQKMRQRR